LTHTRNGDIPYDKKQASGQGGSAVADRS